MTLKVKLDFNPNGQRIYLGGERPLLAGKENSGRVITRHNLLARKSKARGSLRGTEIKVTNRHVHAVTFEMILGGCIYIHY